jgi:hypothetical protein
MQHLLDRFTTPHILAKETGEDAENIREAAGAPGVGSIVWVTDSGEARYFDGLSSLYSDLREATDTDEEADFRSAVYGARGTIDAMEYHGVSDEIIRAFREILAAIESGEA